MSLRFLDTSVLYPLFDRNDPHAGQAEALFAALAREGERPHVTVNVLGELFTTLTRRRFKGGQPLLPHGKARAVLLQLHASFEVHDVTAAHWASALRIKEARVRDYPIWDALHWAAASELGCKELLTLDAPGGHRELEGVRFINPYQ